VLTKQLLAVVLVLLLAFPAWPNPIVVGSVSRSRAATVRDTKLTPGHTIFSDDTIVVGTHGSAWIALTGGAQVQLGENSQARLTKTTDKIQLTIDRGFASFRTAENSEFEALLADATIRSANGLPAVGIISARNPQSTIVAVKKGALLVSTAHDSKMLTLQEGQGVEVALAPGKSKGHTLRFLGGGAAGVGGLLAQSEVRGGDNEEEQECEEVSPSNFEGNFECKSNGNGERLKNRSTSNPH
jgi:hypothetical protein